MLNFSPVSQSALSGLMEIAEESLGLVKVDDEEPSQESSEGSQSDSKEISRESIVPEIEDEDNASEDSEEETEEAPGESPFDKALKQAQAELEGERSKNALLVAKNSLPPIPEIIPFGKLSEEIQAQVLEYCDKFGLDPHHYAHEVQVRYQERVAAEHASLANNMDARKAEGRQAIDDAILKHPRANELGERVAKYLGDAKLVENVKRMDSAGVLPEEIKDYALLAIEQAYRLAELDAKNRPDEIAEKKQRILNATSEQKAKLKKATRGETTRASSTPSTQSSQGDADRLFEAAFDSKNASPWKRLLG